MKKLIHLRLVVALLIVCLSLIACRKNSHPNPSQSSCRIKTITQRLLESTDRHGTVYYNAAGNPDSVIFDIETGSGGATYFYYNYNSDHKLIGYNANYSRESDDYYFRHKYVYSGNRIVRDTAFINEAGSYTEVLDISYDAQGRVIREGRKTIMSDGKPVNNVRDPLLYQYDNEGNLVLDSSAYDTKVNFISVNPVWQFTERDYSKNNPETALSYNEQGLPTAFTEGSYSGFLQQSLPTSIQYDCN